MVALIKEKKKERQKLKEESETLINGGHNNKYT
jgi:hypothetical protein